MEEPVTSSEKYQSQLNPKQYKWIGTLKPGERELTVRVIVLEPLNFFETRDKSLVSQFHVADKSGSVYMNFYGEMGRKLKRGDIVVATNTYSQIHKSQLTLYCGNSKKGIVKRVGWMLLEFSLTPNLSERVWTGSEAMEAQPQRFSLKKRP